MNTVIVFGSWDLTIRETAHMGETVVDMFASSMGKCFLIMFTKAGQQEVVIFLPSL